jgi:hypothetical protein
LIDGPSTGWTNGAIAVAAASVFALSIYVAVTDRPIPKRRHISRALLILSVAIWAYLFLLYALP